VKSKGFTRAGSDLYGVLAVLLVCWQIFLWINTGAECFYGKHCDCKITSGGDGK